MVRAVLSGLCHSVHVAAEQILVRRLGIFELFKYSLQFTGFLLRLRFIFLVRVICGWIRPRLDARLLFLSLITIAYF